LAVLSKKRVYDLETVKLPAVVRVFGHSTVHADNQRRSQDERVPERNLMETMKELRALMERFAIEAP